MCTPHQLVEELEDLFKVDYTVSEDIAYNALVKELLAKNVKGDKKLAFNIMKVFRKQYHISFTNSKILHVLRGMDAPTDILNIFQTKSARSKSGVIVCAIFTSPYPYIDDISANWDIYLANKDDSTLKHGSFSCPHDCWFCPSVPGFPRSYDPSEPGVARALQMKYSVQGQIWNRGRTYEINGHPFDKLELLILGGTWSSYTEEYQRKFINEVYYSANTYYNPNREILPLKGEMSMNMNNKCRIIGITIETRPDKINAKELTKLRNYGVTRVQMGLQHTEDQILKRVNRGHLSRHYLKASEMLLRCGFKFDIHIMPDLPQPVLNDDYLKLPFLERKHIADVDMMLMDLYMTWKLNYVSDYYHDQIKRYRCEPIDHSRIGEEYNRGVHIPYAQLMLTKEELQAKYNYTSIEIKRQKHYSDGVIWDDYYEGFLSFMHEYINIFPEETHYSPFMLMSLYWKIHTRPWVRVNRISRDIPDSMHLDGFKDSNIRQVFHKKLSAMNYRCHCIYCREVRNKAIDVNSKIEVITYNTFGGIEHFIQYLDPDAYTLYGFLRLRLDPKAGTDIYGDIIFNDLTTSAMIRELHVYGQVTTGEVKGNAQHIGIGRKLLEHAEKISRESGYTKMSIISGEGVKGYYSKFGYINGEAYMVKNL